MALSKTAKTVEHSSVTIQRNLEVVEESTQRIRDNAAAVESSTAVIRRNADVVERSTELLGKLHVNESVAEIVLLGLIVLLFGLPIAMAAYLAQINQKMNRFLKEYKKNKSL